MSKKEDSTKTTKEKTTTTKSPSTQKKPKDVDDWIKEIAPSDKLRKWFDHDPDKFEEFDKRYRIELQEKVDKLKELREKSKENILTLLYGAKDTEHNQAIVLKKVLEE